VTLKTLATGIAAVAVVYAATVGVTSTASGAPVPSTAAVQPVVFGIPMPQAPAPELQAPLMQTLAGLAGAGSFAGSKGSYIEGGVGRFETITADRAENNAAAKGDFPLSFNVADIDQEGGSATANVTATTNTGVSVTQPVTFVSGPSPSGWQLSKSSALTLLSSFSS
jgi:hypothetical protein